MIVMFLYVGAHVKNKKRRRRERLRPRKWDKFKDFDTSRRYLKKLEFKGGSENTLKNALRALGTFCIWRGKNPDELIAETEAAIKTGNKEFADELLMDYFLCLTNKNLKRTSAKTMYAYVRSFYRKNGILFYSEGPDAVTETRVDLPTKEELLKVWKAADLDEKVVLGILKSGMRPETVRDLTYGDVKKDYEAGEKRLYIKKVAGKRKLWFATFLTKEATDILRLKMDQRKAMGEVFSNSTPLVTRQRELGKRITTDMIWRIVKGAGDRVGVKLMPKVFRKWFRTYCSPEIGRDATMKMGAWRIPGVGESYFLPPKEETLKNFLKIERLLMFEAPKTGISKEEIRREALLALPNEVLRPTAEKYGMSLAELRATIAKLKPEETIEKGLKRLGVKIVKPKTETNGGDCQRIVEETELGNWLSRGWGVVGVLRSGKVVVESPR